MYRKAIYFSIGTKCTVARFVVAYWLAKSNDKSSCVYSIGWHLLQTFHYLLVQNTPVHVGNGHFRLTLWECLKVCHINERVNEPCIYLLCCILGEHLTVCYIDEWVNVCSGRFKYVNEHCIYGIDQDAVKYLFTVLKFFKYTKIIKMLNFSLLCLYRRETVNLRGK